MTDLEEVPERPVWDEEWTEVEAEGPTRPELEDEWNEWASTRDASTLKEKEKVVKIASGLDFVLALKGTGEVWFHRVAVGEKGASWIYVSTSSITFTSPELIDMSSCPSSRALTSRTSQLNTNQSPHIPPSHPPFTILVCPKAQHLSWVQCSDRVRYRDYKARESSKSLWGTIIMLR